MEQDPLVSTPEGVFHVTPGDEALHTALGIAKKQTFKSHIVRVAGQRPMPNSTPRKREHWGEAYRNDPFSSAEQLRVRPGIFSPWPISFQSDHEEQ